MPIPMSVQHKNPTTDQLIKTLIEKDKTKPIINSEGTDPKRQEKLNEELIEATFTRGVSKK
jgi:hypothetical protein